MFAWFETHARALQAISAVVSALVAVLALAGVAWQVQATFQSQREQSARDIYRDFLSLSVANPDFAKPDYCALKASPRAPAYEAFVTHLLFTAEQSLEMDASLRPAFTSDLEEHAGHLCAEKDFEGFSPELVALVNDVKAMACASVKACPK